MNIIRGKIQSTQKCVIYGPEGIGKSTFVSKFPDPLFIDTEGSTKHMDVARLEKPSSWTMLLDHIEKVKADPTSCKTLAIDTIDWAEQMCTTFICAKHQKSGIEDFGYGSGYIYVKEEFGKFLNLLEDVIEKGIHVALTAHAQMRKFEQPDELGAYDRYELKLGKKTGSQTSPLVKEWADMVLFANYKTYSVAVDDKGKKHKAQGGSRVMYTAHHPCWDAKNRHNLPVELPFDYAGIAHCFSGENTAQPETKNAVEEKINAPAQKEEVQTNAVPTQSAPPEPNKGFKGAFDIDPAIPKALRDLMSEKLVTEEEIQEVVSARGYYPASTPITNYDPDFINGVLIGAWAQVFKMIQDMRDKYEIPFN